MIPEEDGDDTPVAAAVAESPAGCTKNPCFQRYAAPNAPMTHEVEPDAPMTHENESDEPHPNALTIRKENQILMTLPPAHGCLTLPLTTTKTPAYASFLKSTYAPSERKC
jgi:hypothetical protein